MPAFLTSSPLWAYVLAAFLASFAVFLTSAMDAAGGRGSDQEAE
jgi:hypothetical protein